MILPVSTSSPPQSESDSSRTIAWPEADPDSSIRSLIPDALVPGDDACDRRHYAAACARLAVEADPCPARRAEVLEAARPWPHDFAWACAMARWEVRRSDFPIAANWPVAKGAVVYVTGDGTLSTEPGAGLPLGTVVDSVHGDPQPPR